MTLITPPASVNFGFVTGRFALAVADTAADVDHKPDFVPASGTVSFTPAVAKIVTSDPARYISPQTVTASLNSAGVLSDGNGLSGIWLIAGTYAVSFKLAGLTVQKFNVTVEPTHTEAAPLDLVLYTPTPAEPNVVWVVNQQVYDETIAARDEVVALLEGVQGGMGAGIDDAATDVDTTWSSTKINTALAGKVSTTRTVAGKPLSANVTLAKSDVGLGNVDNTSDLAKPLSTAAQDALSGKADATALAGYVPTARTVAGKPLSANVTLAKADVGLSNVDNTADTAKPVSTATQTALDDKANLSALSNYVPTSRTVAGKPLTGPVTLAKADVGLGNVDNTSDAAKPISTATQAAIAYMVTSPNDTVRTIERHGSQAAIPTPYVAKRVYLVPDEA